MGKNRVLLIGLVLMATALLVYTPHYGYPFPRHVDEWHHITEAIKLQKGGYAGGITGFRVGFQIILLLLSKISSLIYLYQFLPAIWAVISAFVLFYVVYRKTHNQFYTAAFSMIFFASIKSNVNITGLWFFTPLSFSIPFIYLYVYLFTEGVEKQRNKYILLSLFIMIFLIFIHSISVLFAIPFLAVYSIFNLKYIKKEWKFFTSFLTIPIIGAIFFKFMTKVTWKSLISRLVSSLQFKYGWGVLELKNSFFELYSLAGYILAVLGLILVLSNKENFKKHLAYALWPISMLISIIIYRKTNVSYLSPYQRNLYYFAISLPLFSAYGLDYLLNLAKGLVNTIVVKEKREISKKIVSVIVFLIIVFFTFVSYRDIPKHIDLYEIMNKAEYQALLFLATIPEKTVVMAVPRVSTAIYPIAGHEPVATFFFYGNRSDSEKFFRSENCLVKQEILKKYKVKYVLTPTPINCGWKMIYSEGIFIYEVD